MIKTGGGLMAEQESLLERLARENSVTVDEKDVRESY